MMPSGKIGAMNNAHPNLKGTSASVMKGTQVGMSIAISSMFNALGQKNPTEFAQLLMLGCIVLIVVMLTQNHLQQHAHTKALHAKD